MSDEVTPPPPPEPPPPEPARTPPKRGCTKYEILVALRRCHGNKGEAAKLLGITHGTICDRVADDPQLRQLYGFKPPNNGVPKAPGELEVMERGPGDVPLPTDLPEEGKDTVAGSLRLISLVSPADSKRLINGLKAFDFSDASLEKIKALGDLATNTGRFIAVSLEKTHQNYVVQQFGLMELAADIRRRLLIPKDAPDYVDNEETRAFLHKNYVEMVRESGRGVERMLQVAEVITRMLEAAGSKEKHKQTKKGWRKVTAEEAHRG